jgi:hypothetical protein
MNLKDVLWSFNNGDWKDISPIFNNRITTFLKFLKGKNLLDRIDVNQLPSELVDDSVWEFLRENDLTKNFDYDESPEEFKNHILLEGLEHNYEDTITFIIENLITDVAIKNGGFYLKLRDREELSEYFCSHSRRSNADPKYVARLILGEEGLGHDWYYDSDITAFNTIQELNSSNLISLRDLIYKEIGNAELYLEDYDSDFFSSLSEEQGTEGYFRIRPEDMDDLLRDEDAINELLNNDLEWIGDELKSLYWNSENTAYEDEVYDSVYNGLDEFFEGRIDEVPRKVGEVTKYDQYIKIRNFVGDIIKFLEYNKGGTYSDSFLDYYGSYTELMKSMFYNDEYECIDISVPDYPDWSRTQKNINEMFHDYL